MHTGCVIPNNSTSALKCSSVLQISTSRGDNQTGESMYILRTWLKKEDFSTVSNTEDKQKYY